MPQTRKRRIVAAAHLGKPQIHSAGATVHFPVDWLDTDAVLGYEDIPRLGLDPLYESRLSLYRASRC